MIMRKEISLYSKIWSVLYNYSVNGNLLVKHISRSIILRRTNNSNYEQQPLVKTEFRNEQLMVPLSSRIPIYHRTYENYDKAIAALAKFVQMKKNATIGFVDVGANVGDTVVNVANYKKTKFLLIEGDRYFGNILRMNMAFREDVDYIFEEAFMTDDDTQGFSYNHRNSSGALMPENIESNHSSKKCIMMTLDYVVEKNGFSPDIIKIDTDGFDLNVIRGGVKTLKKSSPYLFFEWHPEWLERNGEDPMSVWEILKELNYEKGIAFDNFGNPFVIFDVKNVDLLRFLMDYTRCKDKRIYYYDIMVFPKSNDISPTEYLDYFHSFNWNTT